ncbi:hypothetical protein K466DRAFT_605795 [Polyporus arcularius HHB13444]|uniref:Uncharacterized protein n=1 Tax=Polyporus arcularius HHB13444 TaxID=1314778 RepID=A0A5C3NRL7_9APHY|nr:hypothetical protein K466DRAFT_605795 [Polyporus arcularius HHB13444]
MLEPSPPRPPSVPLNPLPMQAAPHTSAFSPQAPGHPFPLADTADRPEAPPHVETEAQSFSFEPQSNYRPATRMGNSFSDLLNASRDEKAMSPTPPPRHTFSFATEPRQGQSTTVNQLGAGIPYFATNLAYGKRPYKRQRSLSSPSPPRDLLVHHYPARENPGTILASGPEGTTLADSLYGPQTANATLDRRQLKPQLVSSREYNDRVHWKAATIYKSQTGVETFEYPKLTPGEPSVDPPPHPAQPSANAATQPDAATAPHAPHPGNAAPPPSNADPIHGAPIAPATWQALLQDDDEMNGLPGSYGGEVEQPQPPPRTTESRSLFAPGFSLAGLLPSRTPAAPHAPPAFPLRKWNLTEAEHATQNTPMHPYRRRIKSPAPDPSNRLFRTDYYQDMKDYPHLNPLQPAASPAVARVRAQLAQEILPTTHVPPPPRPLPAMYPPQISWQAMSMVNARPPLDEESMMRIPPEGGPRIHSDSAWGPFRGLAKARADHILSLPRDRTIKFTIWGSPSATSDPVDVLYGRAQGLISRFLQGALNFQIIAPEAEWGRKVAPNSLNAPGMWIATELHPAQATALANQHCLSTAEITIFCTRVNLENPHFLFRVGKFISKDPDLMLDTVRNAFVEPAMRARTTALLRQNPNYAGMDGEQAFLRFLTTIELDIKEVRTAGGIYPKVEPVISVYCDPPTLNPERWLEWAREARSMKLQHPQFLNSASILPPIRCAGCHSVDHYLDQCEWPEMSDWRAPMPNSSTTNSVFDWFTYSNASSSSLDHPGQSTSRSSDDYQGSRRGGRGGKPNSGGSQGFGRGFGRGQGV